MTDFKFSEVKEVKEYSRYEVAAEQAKAKGCKVVVPKSNELFVDIDCEEDLERSRKYLVHIQRMEKCSYRITESPSGRPGRYHVVVTLERDVEPMERILLQALLGSDRVREVLSWQRLRRGEKLPTLFFEKEDA